MKTDTERTFVKMIVDLLLTMVIFIVLVTFVALVVVSIGRANDWLDDHRAHKAFPDREPPSSRFGWLWFTPIVIVILFCVFGIFVSIYQMVSAM